MPKKLLLAKTLMLTLVLVAILVLAGNGVLAESPKVIHVDGTYTPAYPLPTASPTPAPTPEPTATPTDTQDPTAESTESETPSSAQTDTPTENPTTNPSPTENLSPTTTPTQTSEPAVPELTLIAVIAGLTLAAAMALFSRKSHSTLKRIGAIAVLMAVLMLSLMTNVTYGQSPTPASSPSPVVSYSLWFTNSTALPTDGTNCYGYENGGPFLNIGGIKPIASGFGSSADKTNSIIVLRNDGNIPIDVTLTLQNAQAPADIEISMHYFCMNNHTYLPYSNQWIGNSNVGENPLAPGQYMWLAIMVTLAQPDVPLTGTPNHSFSYSFDIEVTAVQS